MSVFEEYVLEKTIEETISNLYKFAKQHFKTGLLQKKISDYMDRYKRDVFDHLPNAEAFDWQARFCTVIPKVGQLSP